MNASQNTRVRRNLEASIVAYLRPKLNNQIESKKLALFPHGVTQFSYLANTTFSALDVYCYRIDFTVDFNILPFYLFSTDDVNFVKEKLL